MRIQWIGQCAFQITSKSGQTLLIDPYQRVIGLPRGEFPSDVVVFSHRHIDHYDKSAVGPNSKVIEGSGHFIAGDFSVLGVKAYHDNQEGLLSGEVTLYAITVDGYRVVHLSDLGEAPSEESLKRLGRPDVLLFPAGEHTTISLAEAKQLVEYMRPKIAIPMAFHRPGLLMPSASLEMVQQIFPKHRSVKWLELQPRQRLADMTE
ncbi:MAG: MBL fold metallo-hydrolase, partial [Planctomycetes bacterium]|nr:MBL fold metallo-hydrolase [Planctomycetota bacterium]